MKQIPLSGKRGAGLFAIVDDEDYARVVAHRWNLHTGGYVVSRAGYLHLFIMGAPKSGEYDHVNLNKLDCRRANLRPCTHAENTRNRRKPKLGTAPYKGVSLFKITGRWVARIVVDGKPKHLGYYDTPEEGARVYNAAALHFYGEFASLNDGVGVGDIDTVLREDATVTRSNTSGYRGVTFDAPTQKYRAQIRVNGKVKNLGAFDDARAAALAFDRAAIAARGEKAKVNFQIK